MSELELRGSTIQEKKLEGFDYIICAICGEKQKQITHAHLATHNIRFEDYLKQFPERAWRAKNLEKTMIKNQIKSQYNNEKNKCKQCGANIKWNATFCSIKCSHAFRKKLLISVNCLLCGNQFYTDPNKKAKFCSRKCYNEYLNKISNKTKKNGILNRDGHQCSLCNSFKNLRIHHIDENNKNNSEDNLIVLCEKCHRHMHYGIQLTIYKTFTIEIAHHLPNHETCSFLHGHSVHITVGVNGNLNLNTGMVMDFKILKNILQELVISKFDHSYLNDTLFIPTAEMFSFYIFRNLKDHGINVKIVRVHETENNFVEFEPKSK